MLSEKPWRPEVVILFCAAQCACFFFGAAVISLLHKFGVHGFQRTEDFGNILLGTFCFQGATWVLIPVFLRLNQTKWREVFDFGPQLPRALLLAVGVLVLVLPVALLLEKISILTLAKFHWPLQDQAAVFLFDSAKGWPLRVYLGVFAIVLAPVAEEFIFRGVLFPFIKQLGFPRLAWLGVSALFALIHDDPAIFASLFVFALALAWLYEKTGNLLAPITAHALFNATNLAMMIHQNKSGG